MNNFYTYNRIIRKYNLIDMLKHNMHYLFEIFKYYYNNNCLENKYIEDTLTIINTYNLYIVENINYTFFCKSYTLYYNLKTKKYYISFSSSYKIIINTHFIINYTFNVQFLTNNDNNKILFEQFIKYKKYYASKKYRFHDILNISKYNNKNYFVNYKDINHNENDKLILYFLDIITNSKIKKILCNEMLKNILLFLIYDINIINEIYNDL